MKELFTVKGSTLYLRKQDELLSVEPWGDNSLRIRSTRMGYREQNDWALSEPHSANAEIRILDNGATVVNGKLRAEIRPSGKLVFFNQNGKLLLEEFERSTRDIHCKDSSALKVLGREMKAIRGTDSYAITARFESDPAEKLYGMGQYQQPYLNIKGCTLELAQRNSQASVPFLISSLGYGFLWNNPAVGRVTFGKNITEWTAQSSKCLDYWITAGDTPAEIEECYASVTGKVPMMPDYGMGFWQCKLRYRTQEELLEVAREYKRRNLPLDVIVIDYFHWYMQGDWKFDPTYWPDPDAMITELKEMGIELMISVWPTVDFRSENFEEMNQKGMLIHCDRGVQQSLSFEGGSLFADTTNPETRDFMWNKVRQNYYDRGIHIFWLDVAEPEYDTYDFDNYFTHIGSNLQVGNVYPVMYAKTFFDGMRQAGQDKVVNLLRCAWAGSQKYGALVWSGDIASSFSSMRNQLAAGLNMGIAGIPWWTTDIGGFWGGISDSEEFHELLARWFAWGAFCPVMRLHGYREPFLPPMGTVGGATCISGSPNEVWSFGDQVYEVCKKFLAIRESIRPYTAELMKQAHEKGSPIMRTMFYEFPEDSRSWDIEDQYMYGSRYLVAPVMEAGVTERQVYLPAGCRWKNCESFEILEGGQTVSVPAPIDVLPVFERI